MSSAVLELRGVVVDYGDGPALRADLSVPVGVMGAVVGPNGAGKSTLLKAALGLVGFSGHVELLGGRPRDTRRHVGYVPQRSTVDWSFPADALTVVTMGLYRDLPLFRRPGRREKEAASAALEAVGMADMARRQIGRLSGGQQQRVFLARALVSRPRLLLLDEPFAGVDAVSEEALVSALRAANSAGASVIAVHHDLGTLADYFDWLALVNRHVIAAGPTSDVLTDDNLAAAYRGRGAPAPAMFGAVTPRSGVPEAARAS